MKLTTRLILMVTIVVALTDVIEYIHLQQSYISYFSDNCDSSPDVDNFLGLA